MLPSSALIQSSRSNLQKSRGGGPPALLTSGEKAARRLLGIANTVEPQDGRIHIEKINISNQSAGQAFLS